MSAKRVRSLPPVALGLLALAALAFTPPERAAAQTKTTIKVVMHSGINILDPIVTTAHITRNHGYMVFDTLLSMNSKYEPTPQMADFKVSDDKLTYTFTLRDGLTWHDGAPVTADDCVASLKRWGARDAGGQMLMDSVESITADGDKAIVLKLKKPFRYVLDLIAKPASYVPFMMPKRLAETPPTTAVKEIVGSGPFRFVQAEYRPGDRTVYEKFEGYKPRAEAPNWMAGGKAVKVDRVEWINMPDMQTAVNALVTGEIDYMEQPPVDLLPLLQAVPDDVKVDFYNELGSQTMGRMNFLYPPFNDIRIRKAALYALNQESVLQALIGDPEFFQTCPSVYGCGTPLSTEAGEGAATIAKSGDVEKAKALLKEAGYDGTPVVIMHPTDTPSTSSQPVVATELLRAAGFKVDLQPMDWQTLVARRASQKPIAEGGWNMFFTNWVIPEVWNPIVNPMINGRAKTGFFGWPDDPELEKMRADFAAAETDDQRKQIAEKVQARVYDQVIYVPLGQYRQPAAWRASVSGVVKAPIPVFWNMEKKG
ncbi:ABC transporter substrate-binding protein [Chenggangzhangella methanolivorans]|uniref:ABC transporter substrate-binding protein n=1 Tax=Chenggangzhangella methanolivorans TaxID=1437009 RepID=A0A9E6RFF7_9HYPH|nr:ABC transporter substrate-binding protein [Chenggangzhangella methanolivorans]QZO00276.1 ABC transporter substrate-binding protein [Chenggangzhangella methanolivorans]